MFTSILWCSRELLGKCLKCLFPIRFTSISDVLQLVSGPIGNAWFWLVLQAFQAFAGSAHGNDVLYGFAMLYKHIWEGFDSCLNMLKCLNHIRFSSISCGPWVAPRRHRNACFLLVLQAFQAFGPRRQGSAEMLVFYWFYKHFLISHANQEMLVFYYVYKHFWQILSARGLGRNACFLLVLQAFYCFICRRRGQWAGRPAGSRAGGPAGRRPAGRLVLREPFWGLSAREMLVTVTIFKHFCDATIPFLAGRNAWFCLGLQAFPSNPVCVDAAHNMLDFASLYKHIHHFA